MLGFASCEPLSQRALAARFGCDPSNISVIVDRLVERELVERRPDPGDGRVKLIAATDAGRSWPPAAARTASGSGPRSTASRRASSRRSVPDSHCSRASDATIQAVEHLDVVIVGAGLSRDRRRAPSAGPPARAQTYAILEARDGDRRHVGPVPLPGRALGLGHADARLPLPAVDGREGARRRPVDPRVRARDRARGRDRPAGALRPPGPRRRVGRRALDASTIEGREPLSRCGFLYVCGGYYRYDQGYLPAFADAEPFARRDHPPAVLARGPRLRRQARRRHRQRRDRGDARARDGRHRPRT